jgi:hypothetical protein
MGIDVLEKLKSDELSVAVGFVDTPEVLRKALLRTKEVSDVREALRQGAISDDTVRRFVHVLLRDLRLGERFAHELAIAALAVAIERWATKFADEFLGDLSRLRLAEMSTCIRVARECSKNRVQNSSKPFRWKGNGEDAISFSIAGSPEFLSRSSSVVCREPRI